MTEQLWDSFLLNRSEAIRGYIASGKSPNCWQIDLDRPFIAFAKEIYIRENKYGCDKAKIYVAVMNIPTTEWILPDLRTEEVIGGLLYRLGRYDDYDLFHDDKTPITISEDFNPFFGWQEGRRRDIADWSVERDSDARPSRGGR